MTVSRAPQVPFRLFLAPAPGQVRAGGRLSPEGRMRTADERPVEDEDPEAAASVTASSPTSRGAAARPARPVNAGPAHLGQRLDLTA